MSVELTIGLIIIGVAIIVISGYFIYRAITKKKDSGPTLGPGPSPAKTTIVIDENGSSFKTQGTETYIDFPRLQRCENNRDDRPSFCENIKPGDGMNYIYDPDQGDIISGDWVTGFDNEKYECPDGSTDCVYEDVFDASGKTVIGIKNSNGDDFIEKLKDDIWSGKLNLNREIEFPANSGQKAKAVDFMLRIIHYDEKTGALYLKASEDKYIRIIPGTDLNRDDISKQWAVPVGMMIIYILFYYYANGLGKPEIEINVKLDKTFGEVWTENYKTIIPSQ